MQLALSLNWRGGQNTCKYGPFSRLFVRWQFCFDHIGKVALLVNVVIPKGPSRNDRINLTWFYHVFYCYYFLLLVLEPKWTALINGVWTGVRTFEEPLNFWRCCAPFGNKWNGKIIHLATGNWVNNKTRGTETRCFSRQVQLFVKVIIPKWRSRNDHVQPDVVLPRVTLRYMCWRQGELCVNGLWNGAWTFAESPNFWHCCAPSDNKRNDKIIHLATGNWVNNKNERGKKFSKPIRSFLRLVRHTLLEYVLVRGGVLTVKSAWILKIYPHLRDSNSFVVSDRES